MTIRKMAASGWPWLNDAVIAQEPIPPVNEKDDRPSLIDLFKEHRALIDQVATELARDPLFDASKHDDLWIVRFLLSQKKNVKSTIKAAKYTLAFRAERKLDENDIRFFPVKKDVPNEAFKRYLAYCADDTFQFVVPDAKLGVVCFVNIGSVDGHALVKNVNEAEWIASFVFLAEWTHQWTDYLSRTTGRLTSSMRVIDATGVALKNVSMELNKRDGRAMKITKDCYPQVLKALFICHSPPWAQAVWRVVRPLFPKRVVEKMDFLAPDKSEKDRDRMLKYISLENLPTRYGGKNDVWPLNLPLPAKESRR